MFRAYVHSVENEANTTSREKSKQSELDRSRCKEALVQLRLTFKEFSVSGRLNVDTRFNETQELFKVRGD